MAKRLLFRGQREKNGGYCNIHKGINFHNSAKDCSCFSLHKEATHKRHRRRARKEEKIARTAGPAPTLRTFPSSPSPNSGVRGTTLRGGQPRKGKGGGGHED